MITPADMQRRRRQEHGSGRSEASGVRAAAASDKVLCAPLRREVQDDFARDNLVQKAWRSQNIVYPNALHSSSHGDVE